MNREKVRTSGLSPDSGFRANATYGVATAALLLLLPFAILNIIQGDVVRGTGASALVLILALSVWKVYRGRCHQSLIFYGVMFPSLLVLITVFRHDPIFGSLWCFPPIVAYYCMLTERRAWIANVCVLITGISMALYLLPSEYALRVTSTLLSVSVFSAILVRVIDNQHSQLQQQLIHDPLTGLLNRQTLKDKLEHAIYGHHNKGMSSSILAVDVDHFKRINDSYGHDIGDQALLALSQLLKKSLRKGDYAFRTGGEEFVILLNGSAEKDAYVFAERLRREVEIALIVAEQTVTISVGAASYNGRENWTQWMKRADNFLYQAKHLGRNRVTIATTPKCVTIDGSAAAVANTGTGIDMPRQAR